MRSQQRKARFGASALVLALTSASGMAKADRFRLKSGLFWVGYSAHVSPLKIKNGVESRRGRMNLKLIFWPRNGGGKLR